MSKWWHLVTDEITLNSASGRVMLILSRGKEQKVVLYTVITIFKMRLFLLWVVFNCYFFLMKM